MPTKESAGCSLEDALDDEDLATILMIAKNEQSGRVTEREIKLLVAAYRSAERAKEQFARIERQLDCSDKYAAEDKKPDDVFPTVWEIQNGHIRDILNS